MALCSFCSSSPSPSDSGSAGELFDGSKTKGPQKCFRGAVKTGPPRRVHRPAGLDEPALRQKADGISAVHPANFLHVGPRHGLEVSDHRQHLQRRLGELRRLARLQRLPDDVAVLRRGAKLQRVVQADEPDPPAFKSQAVSKTGGHVEHQLLRHGQDGGDALAGDRLAGREKDRLQRALDITHLHMSALLRSAG